MLKTLKNFLPTPYGHQGSLVWYLSHFDIFGIFERDPFGNWLILKRITIFIVGWPTYWRIAVANKLKIEGSEYLRDLPNTNVFFISNHQTYFADVITFYHVFCNDKWGFKKYLIPIYLFAPRARTFYIAASETMKTGIVPKIFQLGGAILVERSWRSKGENVKREVDTSASEKISKGLKFGWVISFPQGTTSPYSPVRKGTARIIKENNPIIVPVVIDGFRRAFNKSGLNYKKRNTQLSIKFKAPLYFDENIGIDELTEKVTLIIEQNIPDIIADFKEDKS